MLPVAHLTTMPEELVEKAGWATEPAPAERAATVPMEAMPGVLAEPPRPAAHAGWAAKDALAERNASGRVEAKPAEPEVWAERAVVWANGETSGAPSVAAEAEPEPRAVAELELPGETRALLAKSEPPPKAGKAEEPTGLRRVPGRLGGQPPHEMERETKPAPKPMTLTHLHPARPHQPLTASPVPQVTLLWAEIRPVPPDRLAEPPQ